MKRVEIETEYTITTGVIRNPGKFEGEMLYAPYFYDCSNDGEFLCGLDDGEYVTLVEVGAEDREQFPEIDATTTFIKVRESEQGFVSVTELTDAQADKVRALYAPDDEDSIGCDQCEALMINGSFCHETGCVNQNARYDAEDDCWVKQRKCFDCGYTVDEDDPCCTYEPECLDDDNN